ncbi:MAG: (2Fe-2S)-binding protein [Cetobacterium sp.]|uniref:(2Fe-2S)-binding protein n=1 Tax=unclassified Cetobacterium TaxID=2630983 RepID=UPI00163CF555|nr:(2Fe-2S)-binding protein [Cetobacterium sp. 2A]MBC2856726.1 (2Fe-2S)-binding protein [Cetobacterium sp. 2A]
MSENKIICFCKNVNYETIVKSIEDGAKTVDQIKEVTGAGTACGRCTGRIQEILDSNK